MCVYLTLSDIEVVSQTLWCIGSFPFQIWTAAIGQCPQILSLQRSGWEKKNIRNHDTECQIMKYHTTPIVKSKQYVYVYLRERMYVRACTCVTVCTCVQCMSICTCGHMRVCMYVHAYACPYVRACIFMSICTCLHIHVHMYVPARTHAPTIPIYLLMYVYMHIYVWYHHHYYFEWYLKMSVRSLANTQAACLTAV